MLLLTDRGRESQRLQQALQPVHPCVLTSLEDALALPPGHLLIVCDVALDVPGRLERLRKALAHHRLQAATPVLFLLRDPSHLTRGQALSAGATAMLQQPMPEADLQAAASRLLASVPAITVADDRHTEVANGVKATGAIIADLLASGAERRPLSLEALERGGNLLLSVIGQAKIQAWLDVVWTHDDATYQHCLLVAGLAAAFAIELGLPPKSQQLIAQAALVHDIGKAQIPREILNKPGPLTTAEMAIMRTHAVAGYRMLVGQPGVDPRILDVVLNHHELLDGTGYPRGLRQEQISRFARAVTICDIYTALIERRPYRKPDPPKVALERLDALGPKLDTALVKAFRNVVRDA